MKTKSFPTCFIAILLLSNTLFMSTSLFAAPPARQFYQLMIYHLKDKTQEERLDKYLAEAYIPAAHRFGIKTVGIFKTANIDTATDKQIFVLISFQSLSEFNNYNQALNNDQQLAIKGADYVDAKFNDAPYTRKESILMEAFTGMPVLKKPVFNNPKSERIYELRSYESATEKLHLNKVQMFNEEEMEIFQRIGSQPVFYAQVIAGSRMPNLMYMTTYSDKGSREEHWKSFGNDPKWKRVSALPKYQNNTSKADIQFIVPTAYSDF